MKSYPYPSFKSLVKTKTLTNFFNLSFIQVSNVLILLVIYPLLTRKVGLESFGLAMLGNAFAGIAGIVVNYGTSQSGVKDVALQKNNLTGLSSAFFNTFLIKLFIFFGLLLIFLSASQFNIEHYQYYVAALPVILAEVINPLFFYLGVEKLKIFNYANIISKLLLLISVLLFIKRSEDAILINSYIGGISTITYSWLFIHAIRKFKLHFSFPTLKNFRELAVSNFYLFGNNVSVQLQQSIMLFAVAHWGSTAWLGAYSICDKIIWSSRLFIGSFSSSMFPKASVLYRESPMEWNLFRLRMQRVSGVMFLLFSIALFIFAHFIIRIVVGEDNQTAETFLYIMAFVPFLAALNSFNVIDLLVKDDSKSIFRIAMALLFISCLLSFILLHLGSYKWFGFYTLITDLSALLIYQYVINHKKIES